MAIAFGALHEASSDSTDGTSYATSSITPTADELQLITVIMRDNSAAAVAPSGLSGNGLTWVKVNDVTDASGIVNTSVWHALGGSPSAGVVTITVAAMDGCLWSWNEFSGTATSGTSGSDAIIQSVTATGTTNAPTVTLAAFRDAGSMAFCGGGSTSTPTWSAGTNFTASGLPTMGSPNGRGGAEYQLAKTDDAVLDWSLSFGSNPWALVGVEIGEPVASGAVPTYYNRLTRRQIK